MSFIESAEFASVGACRFPAALGPAEQSRIAALFACDNRPGRRLTAKDLKPVSDLLSRDGPIGIHACTLIGDQARLVRALLLDKSMEANWALGWHQDRTIAVVERIEVAGFGPWSVKAGQLHVQPPHEFTERMITLRVHIDSVAADNAPLEIIAGSHCLGRLSNGDVDWVVAGGRVIACLAEAGDVWAYGTAIVHRSAEQGRPGRRRVLQLDYSADDLPDGLRWMKLLDAS